MNIEYKFNEGKIIDEVKEYINGTYEGHYSKNKFQSTEFIVDCGHGDGFCLGNIIKYAQRYGKKEGKNKKDLVEIPEVIRKSIKRCNKKYSCNC